jgi:hypothetical protein
VTEYAARGRMVLLDGATLATAKIVADGRNAQNVTSPDRPYYDRTLMQDDATASMAAACAEAAVAGILGLVWHAKVWDASEHHLHRGEPDVGDNIEVRRIREPDNGLVVRESDTGAGKIIVIAHPLPESGFAVVDVIGWLAADDAWRVGSDYRVQTRRVPQRDIRPIDELMGVI